MSDIILYFDHSACSVYQSEINACTRYYQRLIFDNIQSWESEYDLESKRIDKIFAANFDPDHDDPASIYETINELSLEHASTIAEINSYLVGMAIVGIYHLWERQAIDFLIRELRHYTTTETRFSTFKDIVYVLSEFSTPPDKIPQYKELNELRAIANTIKHGPGKSNDELKRLDLDILYDLECSIPLLGGEHSLLRVNIHPRIDHFVRYSKAILSFWDHGAWQDIGDRRPYNPHTKGLGSSGGQF